MKNALTMLWEDIILYNNNRFLIILFLVSLVFLWITEKDKKIRLILVYFVTAITVVFLCPLYAWIGMKVDEQIYTIGYSGLFRSVFWSVIVQSGQWHILRG